MTYYYERLSHVWVLFRLPVILFLIYLWVVGANYFVLLGTGIFFFVDLLHFVNRNGLNIVAYLRNSLRAWGCLLSGKPYGNPVIGISDTTLQIRNNRFKLQDIKTFNPGLGGSEPFILFEDGYRLDLDLSWLGRKDRNEVKDRIQQAILANS